MKYTVIVCAQERYELTTNIYRVVVEEGVAENAAEAAEAAKSSIRDCLKEDGVEADKINVPRLPDTYSVWVKFVFAGEQEPVDFTPPEAVAAAEELKKLQARIEAALGHPLPVRNVIEAELLLHQEVWTKEDFNEWHDAHFD